MTSLWSSFGLELRVLADYSIQSGECRLDGDFENPPDMSVCVQGHAGSEGILSSHRDINVLAGDLNLYLGIHFRSLLSLHVVGESLALDSEVLTENVEVDQKLGMLALRLGNPAVHRLRLTVGKQRIPFGLNGNFLGVALRQLEPSKLWGPAKLGVVTTLDNLKDAQIDFSLSQSDRDPFDKEEERENIAFSMRVMLDRSLLLGTRFYGSIYGDDLGQRRFGLAILNYHQKVGTTQIEWIRQMDTPDGKQNPFDQLMRFAYLGSFQTRGRWGFLYDHWIRKHYMGSVLYEYQFFSSIFASTTLAYQKTELREAPNAWILGFGLRTEL